MGYVKTNIRKPTVFVKATDKDSNKLSSESDTESTSGSEKGISQTSSSTSETLYSNLPSQGHLSEFSDKEACMCVDMLKLIQHHLQTKLKKSNHNITYNKYSDENASKENFIKSSSEKVPKQVWVPKTL